MLNGSIPSRETLRSIVLLRDAILSKGLAMNVPKAKNASKNLLQLRIQKSESAGK